MARWDHLYEARQVDLRAYVLDRVADQLTAELRQWPPTTGAFLDPREEGRFHELLAGAAPPLDAFRVALELARLDLLHEHERIERFWDSPVQHGLLPTARDQDGARFLWRWLVESALDFQDHAQGKFKRQDLVALLERIEDRLLRGLRLRLDEPLA